MARQNEEEDQLKIEVEILLAFFLAGYPGQIQNKSLQQKIEVEIYLVSFFVVGFPTKHLGVSKITIVALLIYCKHFLCSLKCKYEIQNPKSQRPFCTIKIHLSGFGAWKQRDGGCWNGPVTIIHLPEGFAN